MCPTFVQPTWSDGSTRGEAADGPVVPGHDGVTDLPLTLGRDDMLNVGVLSSPERHPPVMKPRLHNGV